MLKTLDRLRYKFIADSLLRGSVAINATHGQNNSSSGYNGFEINQLNSEFPKEFKHQTNVETYALNMANRMNIVEFVDNRRRVRAYIEEAFKDLDSPKAERLLNDKALLDSMIDEYNKGTLNLDKNETQQISELYDSVFADISDEVLKSRRQKMVKSDPQSSFDTIDDFKAYKDIEDLYLTSFISNKIRHGDNDMTAVLAAERIGVNPQSIGLDYSDFEYKTMSEIEQMSDEEREEYYDNEEAALEEYRKYIESDEFAEAWQESEEDNSDYTEPLTDEDISMISSYAETRGRAASFDYDIESSSYDVDSDADAELSGDSPLEAGVDVKYNIKNDELEQTAEPEDDARDNEDELTDEEREGYLTGGRTKGWKAQRVNRAKTRMIAENDYDDEIRQVFSNPMDAYDYDMTVRELESVILHAIESQEIRNREIEEEQAAERESIIFEY